MLACYYLRVFPPGWSLGGTLRNCMSRGVGQNPRVTFREFHGPGPAEGAGQPAELHVELLHRSFHHRCAVRRGNTLECGRGSQL